MVIDLYTFIVDHDDTCALVICAPTGIFYEAQCGGMGCTRPRAEGFFLPLWDIAPQIDECAMGCFDLSQHVARPEFDRPDLRKALADAIDAAIAPMEQRYSFSLRFDYSRIDQLEEGWWPLRIKGTLHDVAGLDHECYYHRGNCD